jgi:hypothetical protein
MCNEFIIICETDDDDDDDDDDDGRDTVPLDSCSREV